MFTVKNHSFHHNFLTNRNSIHSKQQKLSDMLWWLCIQNLDKIKHFFGELCPLFTKWYKEDVMEAINAKTLPFLYIHILTYPWTGLLFSLLYAHFHDNDLAKLKLFFKWTDNLHYMFSENRKIFIVALVHNHLAFSSWSPLTTLSRLPHSHIIWWGEILHWQIWPFFQHWCILCSISRVTRDTFYR